MRIDQLESLVTVSRCKSLSVACEQLHTTVQALSASMRSLETEMGLILLERSSKGVTLTQDGVAVVDIAKRFLSAMHQIQSRHEDARILALVMKPIVIYIQTNLYDLFVPKMVCGLRRQVPGIDITIQQLSQMEQTMEVVIADKADFAFLFCNISAISKSSYKNLIEFHPLFECKLVCLAHKNFPLSSKKTISFKKLQKFPILIYRSQDNSENDMLQLLNTYGTFEDIIFEDDFYMYREMIESGFGIGFSIMTPFESYNRTFSNEITVLILSDDIQLFGGYITKKDSVLSDNSDVFLRYVHNFLLCHGKSFPSCIF